MHNHSVVVQGLELLLSRLLLVDGALLDEALLVQLVRVGVVLNFLRRSQGVGCQLAVTKIALLAC
jgi:hypothetical protein